MTQTSYPLYPADLKPELELRIGKIRSQFRHLGIDALLLADNSNVYYAAARFFRGYVYIPADREPLYFVIRPQGFEGQDVVTIRKPEQIAGILAEKGYRIPQRLGLEFDSLTYSDIERLGKCFPDSEIRNGSDAPRVARMTKTEYELKLMEADGIKQTECYRRVPHLWHEDMTDLELQAEIERVLRLQGALGYTRTSGNLMEINMGSVLHGANADAPTPYDFAMGGAGTDPTLPVGADGSIIHPGETVMIDMSGAFNGYQTDLTRVWKVGDIPGLAVKAHDCSRRILHTLEKEALPGVKVADLYHRAMQIVEEEGLEDYFMGHVQKASFIGHGVGIQLNEQPVITPRSRQILEENMTIAIEPKFVIPHVGAVGIENTYVVTPEGLRNLTPFPEEIAEI